MIGRRIFLLVGTVLLALTAYRAFIGGDNEATRQTQLIFVIAGVGFMLGAVAMAIVEHGREMAEREKARRDADM
ncbi:hypothetical protein [Nonomuraea sediminis]|uniref:hypothetical protein n=1 Tax=Nonomuraea sediminis TaxID=2835864 RepID=UPI001BDCD3EA|nr:hypothetical protein [Nonomuraea sediminis]